MAAPVETLMQYLQNTLPMISTQNVIRGPNTTNQRWKALDVEVEEWTAFTISDIYRQHGVLLQNVLVDGERPFSEPQMINSECSFDGRFGDTLQTRTRRALRATMGSFFRPAREVVFGEGCLAKGSVRVLPDKGIFWADTICTDEATNLVPGELKVSWKWHSGLPREQEQWRSPFRQVLYYMDLYGAQYGFICTNEEFVALRRGDEENVLFMSDSIKWSARGEAGQHVLTPTLALWYLGMLAAA